MATRVGLKKIFLSASYVEPMFQIWWRSVHKSRHNLGDSRRTPDRPSDFIFCPMLLCTALDRQLSCTLLNIWTCTNSSQF